MLERRHGLSRSGRRILAGAVVAGAGGTATFVEGESGAAIATRIGGLTLLALGTFVALREVYRDYRSSQQKLQRSLDRMHNS